MFNVERKPFNSFFFKACWKKSRRSWCLAQITGGPADPSGCVSNRDKKASGSNGPDPQAPSLPPSHPQLPPAMQSIWQLFIHSHSITGSPRRISLPRHNIKVAATSGRPARPITKGQWGQFCLKVSLKVPRPTLARAMQ